MGKLCWARTTDAILTFALLGFLLGLAFPWGPFHLVDWFRARGGNLLSFLQHVVDRFGLPQGTRQSLYMVSRMFMGYKFHANVIFFRFAPSYIQIFVI